jgi:hypothetical protein
MSQVHPEETKDLWQVEMKRRAMSKAKSLQHYQHDQEKELERTDRETTDRDLDPSIMQTDLSLFM